MNKHATQQVHCIAQAAVRNKSHCGNYIAVLFSVQLTTHDNSTIYTCHAEWWGVTRATAVSFNIFRADIKNTGRVRYDNGARFVHFLSQLNRKIQSRRRHENYPSAHG